MDQPRQKTLVFCTAYTHAAAGSFYSWQTRYRTWVDAIRHTSLVYDQILLIDDGSATLPDWPDLHVLTTDDDLRTDAPLVLYHFADHLGRRGISDFPGWVRSFLFAAAYARANQFEKVIHIEADGFLISQRIQQYVNDVQDGWVSFFCPLFHRPESGIQIIAGEAMRSYAEFAQRPIESLAGAVIETTLPFTHVETGFIGDRFGEYLDYVPRHVDWCMQAVANGNIPPETFFWWLPAKQPPADKAPSLPLTSPDAALHANAHPGVWYTDFFWHFDKLRQPRSYFEIGTNAGHSLRCFSCDAVCVDPHFVLEPDVIGGRKRTLLYQATSDEFFSGDDLTRIFPDGFEVAFLDGLHHAEVLLRDFIATEKHTRPGSIIFLHDCLPLNERMAERERRWDDTEAEATRDFWTGDVWKVMVALKQHRPELRIYYLDCGPAGLAVCMNPDSQSTTLSEHYDEISAQFAQMSLSAFGLRELWTLFPMLDSRKLIEDTPQMNGLFGGT